MFYEITEEDKDLLRPLSGRDPLGVMPIWQHRARDIIPHLTAASRELAGFHVLLIALAWWPEFARQYKQPLKNRGNYFILMEQAFARACKLLGVVWTLPGTRRLASNEDGLWIGLGRDCHLLDGQLTNGVWGLYLNPAIKAGLLDENDIAVNKTYSAYIIKATPFIPELFSEIAACLKANKFEVRVIAKRATSLLAQNLSNVIESYPLAKLLKEPILNPSQTPVTQLIVKLMREDLKNDVSPESFVKLSKSSIPEYREIFQNIIDCERYIATMESLFFWLCSKQATSPRKIAEIIPINLVSAVNARNKFTNSGIYKDITLSLERKRMIEGLDFSTKENLVSSIIELHGKVSDKRNNDPWISVNENGQFNIAVETTPPDKIFLDPNRSWRNSYYLPSLHNLVKQFHKAGVRT